MIITQKIKLKLTKDKRFHKAMLNESIVGKLRETVEWVCEKTGSTFELINEYRTTKTCSKCNHVNDSLSPSIRIFKCSKCGYKTARDLNSAINIYKKSKIASYRPLINKCTNEFFYSPFSGLRKIS